ncbi:MAG: methylmalonyl-CoA mutase small subunit [Bacteroidales bacterium]|nr:methylmalonyl-CoA mutase small subunit [Bacteroidales bacterium]
MKEEGNKQLFTEFPEISTMEWEEKIMADLKGAGYQKKLVWKTDEGIDVKPYYRRNDIESLDYLKDTGSLKKGGGAPNHWTICQDIFPEKDLKEANSRIKTALMGGAQAVRIQLKDSPAPDMEMIETLLEGISLDETEIIFQGSLRADALYDLLCKLAVSKGIDPSDLKGSLGADPLGKMATSGIPIASMENIGKLVRNVKEKSPGIKVIDVNGAMIQNSGSTLVEELAFTLAMANEYMAVLTAQGVDPEDALDSMQLSLAAGANYFMEVAKLRAARILWRKISEEYGIDPSKGKIRIHSTSSEWNMTLYDPYVNMLRGTTEAMSSILGGSDLVSVLPFDYPYGKSTAFSDRIARNVQIILREEAYFERVADPASGSYYIESLTDSIGEKAWDMFREVESMGGFRKAFESGWIQELVLKSCRKKLDRASSGKDRILGTNAFPDFNEMILKKVNETGQNEKHDAPLIPLRPFRLSSMFEEVRLQTEKSSKSPRVLLFKHGNPAWMTARAMFSGNFFACAGYEIVDQTPFESIEAGIEVAKETDADIIVLCSSDDAYAEMAPAVYEAMKDRSIIVVAGYPADSVEELQKAGIKHFIHMKSNLLETLQEFNTMIL